MEAPNVSVIIPTYNRLNYLRQALDSVAAQTFAGFEVIVVDDGSTEDIAGGVAGHATRPRVIRQPAEGPAAARNAGLEAARAGVVAFLDSDDLWERTKLERSLQRLHAGPATNIVYGPMSPIDENGRPVPGRTKPCHGGHITEQLFRSSFVHVPTVVCRRDLLLRAGGFDRRLPVCEDYDLWLRLSVDETFALIEEPLAFRRLHPHRLSKEKMSRNLAVKAEVLRRFYENGPANGTLRPEVARPRLARVCFAAARAAFHNGEFDEALRLCRLSHTYGGGRPRLAAWMAGARLLAWLRSVFGADAPAPGAFPPPAARGGTMPTAWVKGDAAGRAG
jgi:GT2 family glycosyltransferase